ncbi:MAG: oligosaccharide flippase family protein [Ketobacteraceae bacterium]|nr:oligosaccharide flippase family protein [Ketobacteraceae bacterium]
MTTQEQPTREEEEMARHFGRTLATKIAMVVIRLARNAILARVLGPADRGLFSLISSLPELIMTAGNAGLSNAAAYHTAKKSAPTRQIIGNTNSLILLISIVLIAFSFWLVEQPWLSKDYEEALSRFNWVIALAIPLMLIKVVNINLLNVLQRINSVNLVNFMESLLPLVLFLVLWWIFDVAALPAAVSAWLISLALLAIFSIARLEQGVAFGFDGKTQKDLLSFGSRGYFDTLFQKLLLRVDFLFISAMIGNEALGYYAMASAAAELMLIIPNALSVPLFSFFLRKSAQDKNTVTPMVLRVLTTCMILIAIGFAVLGEVLIWILFGKEFLPAYEPLLWLLPGVVFLSYSSLIRLDLLGHNMPGTISVISGMAVLTNVVLNLVLIPGFGVAGAAMAATAAYTLAAIGLAVVHSRLTGINTLSTLLVTGSDIKFTINLIKSSTQKDKGPGSS